MVPHTTIIVEGSFNIVSLVHQRNDSASVLGEKVKAKMELGQIGRTKDDVEKLVEKLRARARSIGPDIYDDAKKAARALPTSTEAELAVFRPEVAAQSAKAKPSRRRPILPPTPQRGWAPPAAPAPAPPP